MTVTPTPGVIQLPAKEAGTEALKGNVLVLPGSTPP